MGGPGAHGGRQAGALENTRDGGGGGMCSAGGAVGEPALYAQRRVSDGHVGGVDGPVNRRPRARHVTSGYSPCGSTARGCCVDMSAPKWIDGQVPR